MCNSIDQITSVPGKDGLSGAVWYHHLDSEMLRHARLRNECIFGSAMHG